MLIGIDWPTDMNGVINRKKCKMIFEKTSMRIVVTLDLAEGLHYTEPVHDNESDDDLDCIYKITVWEQEWVNPTMDGQISWKHTSSYTSDSDKEIE